MTQSCTVYSPVVKHAEVLALVKRMARNGMVEVTGSEGAWDRIRVVLDDGSLVLNSMQRREPGDEFSRLILGTHNFFRTLETDSPQKKKILDFLLSCQWAVGAVAEPEFNTEDERLDIIFAVAELLDGMIFNGSEMITSEGQPILGA